MAQPAFSFDRDAFDVAVPAAKRSHASRAAAERLTATRAQGPKMARLLDAYAHATPSTLIDSEVERYTGLLRGSICSLRAAAVRRDWVRAVGTRVGPYGVPQTSHRITVAGIQALTAWRDRQARRTTPLLTKGPVA